MIHACFREKARIFSAYTTVGNGDDASVHQVPEGYELVVSTDTSLAGVHWPHDFPVQQAAHRAVCSALSDMAAMGAQAQWTWVSVMANTAQELKQMGEGVTSALNQYQVELSGGDTVSSPVAALNVTVSGMVPQGTAMQRNQAQVGDTIWLLGRVGWASLGLQAWFDGDDPHGFVPYFQEIEPKLTEGMQLRAGGVACCIDVSDGLLQDAGHIAQASGVGMLLELEHIPDWHVLSKLLGQDAASRAVLSGGEDYALLCTAPAALAPLLQDKASAIGHCVEGCGISVTMQGQPYPYTHQGFDHFDSSTS